MVPLEGFEPSTCRLSGATGYKSAALPLSYRGETMISPVDVFELSEQYRFEPLAL
jgi:hypothetical protein